MSPAEKIRRSPLLVAVAVAVLISGSVLWLRQQGSLQFLELAAFDWCIKGRPKTTASLDRIALVLIDETDLLNQKGWPLSDGVLAAALERLAGYGPRAIGVDIYRDLPVPPGTDRLNRVLAANGNIIMIMKLGDEISGGVPPPPVLDGTEQVGFSDLVIDPGGTQRRGLLFLDDTETVFFSFALRNALLYLQHESIFPAGDPEEPSHLRLGARTLPPLGPDDGPYVRADTRGYQLLFDYRDNPRVFVTYSLSELLEGRIARKSIQDKVVLLGVNAASVKDAFFTPLSWGGEAEQQLPGILVHAHGVSQLLRAALDGHQPLQGIDDWLEMALVFCWGLLGAFLGLYTRSAWRFSLAAAAGLCLLAGAGFQFFLYGWMVPVVSPALAWLVAAAVVTAYAANLEKKQTGMLMQIFSRHVSDQVAASLWAQREHFLDGSRPRPQKLTATILFTDLVSFTTVSERLAPQELMDWLNEYLEGMGRQIMAQGGIINKYIGDSIMAIFGVPVPRSQPEEIAEDAARAVRCALEMKRELKKMNAAWQQKGMPVIGTRIGIYTGPVVAGSVGTAERLEYTVLGDSVNIAARLESFRKEDFAFHPLEKPCRILVGDATAVHLDGGFHRIRMGEAVLKGKGKPVLIYEIDELPENGQLNYREKKDEEDGAAHLGVGPDGRPGVRHGGRVSEGVGNCS